MCAATVAAAYPTSVSGKTVCVANGVVSYQGSVANTEEENGTINTGSPCCAFENLQPSQSIHCKGELEKCREGGALCQWTPNTKDKGYNQENPK